MKELLDKLYDIRGLSVVSLVQLKMNVNRCADDEFHDERRKLFMLQHEETIKQMDELILLTLETSSEFAKVLKENLDKLAILTTSQ
ncbi:MAG: hypothetical protein KAJ10_16745 [Thermodesulfovibrionia bacterium]|nr:hypothetical protein [Thermodesulfovibrionia bacterium]